MCTAAPGPGAAGRVSAAAPAHLLSGASVLVCGASGGIGCALARELHRRGAVLTLAGRDRARLEAVPVPGLRLAADLGSAQACEQALALAAQDGRLDVVINAVGAVAFGGAGELPIEAMEALLRTNVLIPMMLARGALGRLSKGGAIVNVSGVIAERNLPGMAAYGASKAALSAFDQALAREARRAGLRVIDARPPHTETGLHLRPIAGAAPALGEGIAPARVAEVICDALEQGIGDLPASAF